MKTDRELQDAVEQEIQWEPSIQSEHIGVSVTGGVVQLDGYVSSYNEKWGAERAALRVGTVKAVASELKVKLPSAHLRTDVDIARAAADHLDWNIRVPKTVKVQVSDGIVTLEGTVEWQYQREVAARTVGTLTGVKAVVNNISVTPGVSAVGLKRKIEDALKRNAEINAENIFVETDNCTVTLRGSVRTWMERDEAERIAWAAPGITDVRDYLTLEGAESAA